MRLDEEEVLIRDDSGLLHGGESTYPVTAVRQSGWCKKLTRTLSLSLGFFVLGLCFAIPGPTLLDLGDRVEATVGQMMMMFAARSVGYLLGAITGGVLFDCFDKQLLLFVTLLISSVATVTIPWSLTLVVMATMFGLQGITMGVLDTGGNVFCIRIWGRKSGPYIQTLHFAFGIGAFIAPLLATPFLSHEMVTYNTSLLEGNIPVSPFLLDKMRHNRSLRSEGIFTHLDPDFNPLIDVINTHESLGKIKRKRRDGASAVSPLSSPSINTTPSSDGKISEGNENDLSNPMHEGVNSPGGVEGAANKSNKSGETKQTTAKSITQEETPDNGETLENKADSVTSPITTTNNVTGSSTHVSVPETKFSSVGSSTLPVTTTSSTATTTTTAAPVVPGAGKKPSAATDDNLKNSFTDGEKISPHLDEHKNEPDNDGDEPVSLASKQVNETGPTNTQVTSLSGLSNSSGPSANMSVTTSNSASIADTSSGPTQSTSTVIGNIKSVTDNVTSASVSNTMPKLVTSTEKALPENKTVTNDLANKTSMPDASVKSTTSAIEIPASTAASVPITTLPTTHSPTTTTESTTTSTTTTTTTESTTKTTTTTTTVAPTTTTTTTTEKVTTPEAVTEKVTVKPTPKLTTTANPDAIVYPSHTASVPPTIISSSPKTREPNTSSNSNTTQFTEASTKPSTTNDTFLNNAINIIRNISRIQVAYLIIGIALFINAVIFLALYCKDKGRLSATNDVDEVLAIKNIGGCYRGVITVLMGLFQLCYMGLEVTYGALVTSFVVDFLHWPKTQGATVAAIFWGSLATGRGFSIFIARCCGPVVMLSIDLVLMVIGGLILAIGLYFYTRLIWLGTLVLGLGMSSVFPASLSWAEHYIHLTGKTTAFFTLGSGLGQIIFPTVTGYFFERFEKIILMQATAGVSVFLLLLFIVVQCLASRSSQKVFVRDRNGFLPLEDEDEENVELDLIHFDKSETRRRKDKRAKGETEYKTLISDLEDD